MTTLLVGLDSAWTPTNFGGLIGVLHLDDGTFRDLDPPQIVNYPQAEQVILKWQHEQKPKATIVLFDQPTIVKNAAGQRPVENLLDPWLAAGEVACSRPTPPGRRCSERRHRCGHS